MKENPGEGQVLQYIVNDDISSLFEIINKGLDVNQQFLWYMGELPDLLTNSPPLLSVAAYYQAIKCFKFLLDKGADISHLDEMEVPLSHFAVAGGSMEIIESLVQKGVDFSKTLHLAAEYGHYEVFLYLHQTFSLDLQEKDQYNRTFLHIASSSGNIKLVSFLIEKGLDINEIDGIHFCVLLGFLFIRLWTPLHFAVEKRRTGIVKHLLSNSRININCKDFVFESTLIMWHEYGNCMPLHHAVMNGDLEIAELLLNSNGIDVNCKDGVDYIVMKEFL